MGTSFPFHGLLPMAVLSLYESGLDDVPIHGLVNSGLLIPKSGIVSELTIAGFFFLILLIKMEDKQIQY